VVNGPGPDGRGMREILLPAVEPVLVEVDLARRTALVDPPAGLVEA